jgi:ELWxxDGT repeat protein
MFAPFRPRHAAGTAKRPITQRQTRRRLLVEALEDRCLPSASLVRDINVNTASSTPTDLVDVNGLLYFSATDNAGNISLFTSDGTAAHTALVKEFGPANYPISTGVFNLTNLNGEVFFDVATNGFGGRAELWESDGTAAGTRLVKNFTGNVFVNPNGGGAPPTFVAFQNSVYFLIEPFNDPSAVQLWKTDGANTVQVDPGAFSVSELFPALTVDSGTLYFAAADPVNGTKLWKTDGTDAGTQIADPSFAPIGVLGLTNVNSTLYFFAVSDPTFQTNDLYKFDGTHTTLVKSGFSNFGDPEGAAVNGELFFSAASAAAPFDQELWVSDGTDLGTRMVHPAHEASFGLNPFNLTSFNGRLLFAGFDDSGGESIWVSDGSDAGTQVIFPNTAAFALLFPEEVATANNTLYFGAQGLSNNQELWQTDGTAAGTSMIADFGAVPFTGGPPFGLTISNGTLFFDATDKAHGAELWSSDGTAGGTQLVKDINTNTVGSFPAELVNNNGELFFTANDGQGPQGFSFFNPEIWKSDGTSAGTQLVSTPFPGGGPSREDGPVNLRSLNGKVLFTPANDPQLWVTDGTAGGTQMLKDFSVPGAFVGAPDNLTVVGDELFFTVFTADSEQLWKSDGTAGGTVLVADNVIVVAESGVAVGNTFFFISVDLNTFDFQLWKSDGTAAGTHVADAAHPGANVNELTNVGGTLFYFDSGANFNDQTLWSNDGTTSTLLAHIHPGDYAFPYDAIADQNNLYFAVTDNSTGVAELWKSDGTPGGTGPVATVRPDFGNVVAVGGRLFFTVNDPVNGEQLWVSGGTAANTHIVASIVAGRNIYGNPLPFDLTSFDGKVFFAASDAAHGQELWESNGTAGGSFMVQDINPGAAGSAPIELTAVNDTLYFTADDGAHGRELWAFRNGRGGRAAPSRAGAGSPNALAPGATEVFNIHPPFFVLGAAMTAGPGQSPPAGQLNEDHDGGQARSAFLAALADALPISPHQDGKGTIGTNLTKTVWPARAANLGQWLREELLLDLNAWLLR